MKLFRSVLFWLHLTTGVVAGVVILVMCVTGVALTYEKQMLEWADRRSGSVPLPADARPLPPETLLASAVAAEPGAAPTGITARRDPRAPVTVSVEGGRPRLVDPYTGAILGEPSPRLRAFFRTMTDWHRWIALQDTSRATGKAITGAANLGFLFIVLSGIYLWVPRVWTRLQFTQVLWFRGGLPGKARDFNWHNVIGIWSAIPLAIVVAGAVPISYSWAGNLVYRIAGEAPPGPPAGARPGGRERGGAREERPRAVEVTGLDAAWAAAQAQVPAWRTISVRLGGPAQGPYVITSTRATAASRSIAARSASIARLRRSSRPSRSRISVRAGACAAGCASPTPARFTASPARPSPAWYRPAVPCWSTPASRSRCAASGRGCVAAAPTSAS